jgi:hypothetical protein
MAGIDRWNKSASHLLPTATGAKTIPPPLTPVGKGLRPKIQLFNQSLTPLRRQPMGYRSNQNNHDTEINLASQKTNRRGGAASSTTLLATAQTETGLVILIECARKATGLTRIVGDVKYTVTTMRAAILLYLVRNILVNGG